MSAEWYDFVPLPNRKERAPDATALTHAKHVSGKYSGYLDLRIVTKSPVHVGSGVYELSEDAGLQEGTVVKAIARVDGKPVIPSSSLKGALRAVYETITYSCVGRPRTSSREKYSRSPKKSELPQTLIDQMPSDLQTKAENARYAHPRDVPTISVRLDKWQLNNVKGCELKKLQHSNLKKLCPACALFGIENFQGRVSFDDAVVTELPKEPKQSVALSKLYGPRLHRLGNPTVVPKGKATFVQVRNLKGRKAYYNVHQGEVPAEGQILVDYLPRETQLSTRLHFRNITLTELGGLLTALGLDCENDFPFRVGGGKPLGLGYIAFELQNMHVLDTEAAFIEFEPSVARKVTTEACLQAFKSNERLFYRNGLEKLCEITARPYVPDEEENQ